MSEIEQDGVDTARTDHVVARRLDVTREALRAWRHRGLGPIFCRFGRSVRYLDSDIDAFIRASRVTPPPVDIKTDPMEGNVTAT